MKIGTEIILPESVEQAKSFVKIRSVSIAVFRGLTAVLSVL